MTIIEPHKAKLYIGEFLYVIALLALFSVLSIFLYNRNVNLRYNISAKEKAAQSIEVQNADLRNELYTKTDVKNLSNFIQEHNLIQDRNPDYIEHKALANR